MSKIDQAKILVRNIFSNYDKNDDDVLSLREALEYMARDPTLQSQINHTKIFNHIDKNNDQSLSKNELGEFLLKNFYI